MNEDILVVMALSHDYDRNIYVSYFLSFTHLGDHDTLQKTQSWAKLPKSESYVGLLKVSEIVDRRIRSLIVISYIFSNLKKKKH